MIAMTARGSNDDGLRVQNMSVRYGPLPAVEDVSFSVAAGEVYGILGPSGAGKSSILGALTGVVTSSGRILIDASEISPLAPRHRRFGNVYQDFRLFNWLSVFDNAAFGCRALGWNRIQTQARVEPVLRGLGLDGSLARPVAELSGGERQRVALARALACEPRALLLDEPFSDLDPPLRLRLRTDLLRWLTHHPIPVVLVTHDRLEAFEVCDRIGFLCRGRLHQEGTPAQLHDHPATIELAEFMGYGNRLEGVAETTSGGTVRVRTPVATIDARLMGAPVEPGQRLCLCCRPQSVAMADGVQSGENRMAATCEALHRVEERTRATLLLAGGEIWTADWPASAGIRPGGGVSISVPPASLLAYANTNT